MHSNNNEKRTDDVASRCTPTSTTTTTTITVVCSGCGKPPRSKTEKLLRCGRCKQVCYHDRQCQLNHFPQHKLECKQLAAQAQAAAAAAGVTTTKALLSSTPGIRVLETKDKGRVVMANQDFQPGDVVLREHPTLVFDTRLGYMGLLQAYGQASPSTQQAILQHLYAPPLDAMLWTAARKQRYHQMEQDCHHPAFRGTISPNIAKTLLAIVETNGYQLFNYEASNPHHHHDQEEATWMGLFLQGSMLEHSCIPNVTMTFQKDGTLQLRAETKIAKDERLAFSYMEGVFEKRQTNRQEYLLEHKHFTCCCCRCHGQVILTDNKGSASDASDDEAASVASCDERFLDESCPLLLPAADCGPFMEKNHNNTATDLLLTVYPISRGENKNDPTNIDQQIWKVIYDETSSSQEEATATITKKATSTTTTTTTTTITTKTTMTATLEMTPKLKTSIQVAQQEQAKLLTLIQQYEGNVEDPSTVLSSNPRMTILDVFQTWLQELLQLLYSVKWETTIHPFHFLQVRIHQLMSTLSASLARMIPTTTTTPPPPPPNNSKDQFLRLSVLALLHNVQWVERNVSVLRHASRKMMTTNISSKDTDENNNNNHNRGYRSFASMLLSNLQALEHMRQEEHHHNNNNNNHNGHLSTIQLPQNGHVSPAMIRSAIQSLASSSSSYCFDDVDTTNNVGGGATATATTITSRETTADVALTVFYAGQDLSFSGDATLACELFELYRPWFDHLEQPSKENRDKIDIFLKSQGSHNPFSLY